MRDLRDPLEIAKTLAAIRDRDDRRPTMKTSPAPRRKLSALADLHRVELEAAADFDDTVAGEPMCGLPPKRGER